MTGDVAGADARPLFRLRNVQPPTPPLPGADAIDRLFHLDADFRRDGTWSGVRDLVAVAYLELAAAGEDALIDRHAYELHRVLPEHRDRIVVRHACLTDTARGSERTRNFPLDRAYRLLHGLVELLLAWKQASAPGRRWVVAVEGFGHVQHLGARFFAELARRGAAASIEALVDDPAPVAGIAGAGFVPAGLAFGDLGLAPLPHRTLDDAARETIERQLRDNDILDWEAQYPTMLAHAIERGDARTRAHIALRALCICNHYGYYHESASFADDVLPHLDDIVGDDEDARWNYLGNIFQGLATTGAEMRAREIVLTLGEPRLRRAVLRAKMHYLLSMSYLRYTAAPDLPRAEHHIVQAAADIEAARPEIGHDDYSFLKVFIDNGLAFLRVRQGRQAEALALCQDGYAFLTGEVGEEKHMLHRSVLQYNTAQVHVMLGRHDDAMAHYRKSIEMDPYYSEYYNEVGNILQRQERYEEANAMYALAIAYSAPYPEVHHNKGICHSALGEIDAALASFDRSLEMNPLQPELHAMRAELLEAEGRSDEALADYEAALALAPDLVAARVNRAVLHYEAGRFEAALADMDRAIALEPQQPDHYLNRAEIHKAMAQRDLYQRDLAAAEACREAA